MRRYRSLLGCVGMRRSAFPLGEVVDVRISFSRWARCGYEEILFTFRGRVGVRRFAFPLGEAWV